MIIGFSTLKQHHVSCSSATEVVNSVVLQLTAPDNRGQGGAGGAAVVAAGGEAHEGVGAGVRARGVAKIHGAPAGCVQRAPPAALRGEGAALAPPGAAAPRGLNVNVALAAAVGALDHRLDVLVRDLVAQCSSHPPQAGTVDPPAPLDWIGVINEVEELGDVLECIVFWLVDPEVVLHQREKLFKLNRQRAITVKIIDECVYGRVVRLEAQALHLQSDLLGVDGAAGVRIEEPEGGADVLQDGRRHVPVVLHRAALAHQPSLRQRGAI
eukprot:CAMPEP_0175476012 /NCGR_PEP_ID=MMETSP0095-20121207/75706_1 /TAXON_ID=311494 /ORGANISM="Alexandrium monilatum, Strain CCMP3105" /LENGTH=267 /DNA_ID=CAMNT_0016777583 /DNA_START=242 /DNA_END=1044 /DNA_ORIENTATION=+